MEGVKTKYPHLFLWETPNKGEGSILKEPGSSTFDEEIIACPVCNYREVRIFLHNLAINPASS